MLEPSHANLHSYVPLCMLQELQHRSQEAEQEMQQLKATISLLEHESSTVKAELVRPHPSRIPVAYVHVACAQD
jgi:hypothetical protein